MSILKKVLGLSVGAMILAGLAGCAAEPISITDDTTIVDVRTSEEYEAGHLEGAINIDIRGTDFDARIAELPADARYVVYCASGNRSASAVERMTELGLTDLVDAGGMSSASASTGLEVVTDD